MKEFFARYPEVGWMAVLLAAQAVAVIIYAVTGGEGDGGEDDDEECDEA